MTCSKVSARKRSIREDGLFKGGMRQNRTPTHGVKVLFFIGVDWFFYSHFLDRAIAAKEAGYDVVVLTGLTREDDPLTKYGIKLIGIPFERRSMNPLGLIRNLVDVIRVLKQEKPDIVHQIALKPILIGSIACKLLGIKRVISAVVGLGFAFSSDKRSARIIRRVLSALFRVVLDKHYSQTVFENTDDLHYFVDQGWVKKENAILIRGAGVDIDRFTPVVEAVNLNDLSNEPASNPISTLTQRDTNTVASNISYPRKPPVVMLLSRMLWDKGIGEFVQAARQLRQKFGDRYARFVLVGDPDDDNRGAISREQLTSWQEEGVIEWWGYQTDVQNTLAQATISCLPSYREGLPKSLLESLAMGLPCVATDVPGCREAVIDGVNGFLVRAKDSDSLARALDRLLRDAVLLIHFGQVSRRMAVEEFSCELVNQQTLELYEKLIA